jgi:hypothetical protein
VSCIGALHSLKDEKVIQPGVAGPITGPSKLKPVNLPAWRTIKIDMDHIASGHMTDEHIFH